MPGSLLPCLPSMVEAALSKTRILINGQVRGRRWQQPVAHSPSCFGLALCSLPPSLPPTWTSNSSSLPASISCLPRRPVPSVPSRAALPCKNGDIVLAERMKESSIVWRRRAPSLKRVLRANSCPARRRVKDHPVVVSHDKTQSLSLSPRRRPPSYSGEREGRFDGEEALGVGSKASDAHGDFRHLS